jgi:hypothetical protein
MQKEKPSFQPIPNCNMPRLIPAVVMKAEETPAAGISRTDFAGPGKNRPNNGGLDGAVQQAHKPAISVQSDRLATLRSLIVQVNCGNFAATDRYLPS